MSRDRRMNAVGAAVVALMLVVTVLFMGGEGLGIQRVSADMPYVESLFSTDRVHTLDIVVDETTWQGLLDNASAKEYIPVNLVIDGRAVKNVGLRAKGNSSLATMVSSDSDRYSFKVEFDHYQGGQTYMGLDKLALNNIIQDDTYLKDYLCYQLMAAFDADAPLCSFIYVTLNGEDFGLYLAVEGIEESFAQRRYGADYGQIYKPDSMDIGGGGKEGGRQEMPDMPAPFEGEDMPDFAAMFENGEMPDFAAMMPGEEGGEGQPRKEGGGGGFGGFGMGGDDVSLRYVDDDPESYPNIFDNAVFDASNADARRVIQALKQLGSGEDLETAINVEEVLRYFVVHNFVLNFDSYTGSMIHNYHLYEKEGILSMIAWDYNLAFGAFAMGGGRSQDGVDSATSLANYPIDTPLSNGTLAERPMIGRLLENETYLARYHELFGEFLQQFFRDGAFVEMIDQAIALISPYVEKDPTAFCTYEAFTEASASLRAFCLLRAESIEGQLDGSIPATSEGQAADASALVDASSVNVESMNGGMGNMGGFGGMRRPEDAAADAQTQATGEGESEDEAEAAETAETQSATLEMPADMQPPEGMQLPEGMSFPAGMTMPEGMTPPEGMALPEGMTLPEGMSLPEGMTLPEGMEMPDMANMPKMSKDSAAQSSATAQPEDETDVPEAAVATQTAEKPAETELADAAASPDSSQAEGQTRAQRTQGMQFPSGWSGETQAVDRTQTYWLLGVSAGILLLGLLFAFLYHRK